MTEPTTRYALPASTRAAFETFHQANPSVYRMFRDLALEAAGRGAAHLGGRMLWEVMRYRVTVQAEGNTYKLNNDYCPFYVRLLLDEEPHLRPLFERRKALADAKDTKPDLMLDRPPLFDNLSENR
jgi:hypothetical protein